MRLPFPSRWALPALLLLLCAAAAGETPSAVEELRRRVELGCSPIETSGGVRIVCADAEVRALYDRRSFAPAWTDENGPLPSALALEQALSAASEHGLRAEDYHLAAVRERLTALAARPGARDPEVVRQRTELEVLLADAFLLYGAHLLAGRVDPASIHPDWIANPRTADVVGALERAIVSGRPQDELSALAPSHPEYAHLRQALARYRGLAETGWAEVSDGPVLRPGDAGPRVAELRARLGAERYEVADGTEPEDLFDPTLEAALRQFQERHALEADGACGPRTLAALNVSAAERVRQLEVNLERWRWLPQDLGARHVRIDVARFRLNAVEDGRPVLSMPVVVGTPYTRTPTFSSRLTAVILNPSWRVPRSIAATELLAEAREDPGYLVRNGFKVFRGGDEVDPRRVDWARVSPDRLGLTFLQRPGPKNALGRVKFLLPNPFDVYLHDTPARGLFARPRRDFSHGCVRLGRPVELAEYLLRDDPSWPRTRIEQAIRAGREQTLRLREKVPVHLLYGTAWVEEDGAVHFGDDLYGRDGPVAEALEAPAPAAEEPEPWPAGPATR